MYSRILSVGNIEKQDMNISFTSRIGGTLKTHVFLLPRSSWTARRMSKNQSIRTRVQYILQFYENRFEETVNSFFVQKFYS